MSFDRRNEQGMLSTLSQLWIVGCWNLYLSQTNFSTKQNLAALCIRYSIGPLPCNKVSTLEHRFTVNSEQHQSKHYKLQH